MVHPEAWHLFRKGPSNPRVLHEPAGLYLDPNQKWLVITQNKEMGHGPIFDSGQKETPGRYQHVSGMARGDINWLPGPEAYRRSQVSFKSSPSFFFPNRKLSGHWFGVWGSFQQGFRKVPAGLQEFPGGWGFHFLTEPWGSPFGFLVYQSTKSATLLLGLFSLFTPDS